MTRAQRVLALLALAAAEKPLPEDIPPRPTLIYARSDSGLSGRLAETQCEMVGGGAWSEVPEHTCPRSQAHPRRQALPSPLPARIAADLFWPSSPQHPHHRQGEGSKRRA